MATSTTTTSTAWFTGSVLFSVLILSSIPLSCALGANARHVRLGIIIPFDGDHLFIAKKALPAVDYAVDMINSRPDFLPSLTVVKFVRDSKCSEIYGPLAAIEYYVTKTADVFIGPCCDFAVAPVARFSPHWNIPLISPVALVLAFEDKVSVYKQLTRISGSYMKCAEFVLKIFRRFQWSTIGILFQNNENAALGRTDYFFAMEALNEALERGKNFTAGLIQFDPKTFDPDGEPKGYAWYLRRVSREARGKHNFVLAYQTLVKCTAQYDFFCTADLILSPNANASKFYLTLRLHILANKNTFG